jgi:hypothetical protein
VLIKAVTGTDYKLAPPFAVGGKSDEMEKNLLDGAMCMG